MELERLLRSDAGVIRALIGKASSATPGRRCSTSRQVLGALLVLLPLATSGCAGAGGYYSDFNATTLDSGIRGSHG